MTAQEKANARYENLCAQYADQGFKIDELIHQRRKIKVQIEALRESVPHILQAEHDAKEEAMNSTATTGAATPKLTGVDNAERIRDTGI